MVYEFGKKNPVCESYNAYYICHCQTSEFIRESSQTLLCISILGDALMDSDTHYSLESSYSYKMDLDDHKPYFYPWHICHEGTTTKSQFISNDQY